MTRCQDEGVRISDDYVQAQDSLLTFVTLLSFPVTQSVEYISSSNKRREHIHAEDERSSSIDEIWPEFDMNLRS